VPARDAALDEDAIADRGAVAVRCGRSDRRDPADDLVAEDDRVRRAQLAGGVLEIGPADAAQLDVDQRRV